LIEAAPIGEDLTVTIERGGNRQDIKVRPRAQPVTAVNGPSVAGPRLQPEGRSDGLPGRVRGRERAVPRQTPPLSAPASGEENPAALEPIPTQPPSAPPAPEPPANQPEGNPR
jgi:hypothetical protein